MSPRQATPARDKVAASSDDYVPAPARSALQKMSPIDYEHTMSIGEAA